MSEIVPVTDTPAPVTPDFGAMESIAEYRRTREAGIEPADVSDEATVDAAVEAPAAPVVEPKADAEPDPASEAGKELARKKTSLQGRINELTREKHESRREADEARAALNALRAELAALKTGKPAADTPSAQPDVTAPQSYTGKPKPVQDDFETWEAFNEALVDWKVEEREAKAAIERQQTEVLSSVKQRTEKFRAEHPDYDDVVNSAYLPPDAPASGAILAHLRHADLGPHLAYELGSNPAELARIVSLPPGFAVAALGRLEAKIEARLEAANSGPAPVVAPVTTAPDPIKPVGGSSSGASTADPKEINSVATWRKVRSSLG